MVRQWKALLCALLLLMALVPPPAEAAWDDNLIFIAVNISLLPLLQYMPITMGGSVYVPVMAFDASTNGGSSLGIYGASHKGMNTYTLYDAKSKNLIFDLATGNSYDYLPQDGGTQQTARCMIRNGKTYVTASSVCRYFGIDYTYRASTDYGYPLVRIKTKDAPLTDDAFISAASSSAMLHVINEYYRMLAPEPPTETPTPTLMPTPLPSPAPTTTPRESSKPGEPVKPEEPDHSGVLFELAVRIEGEGGKSVLDALAAEGRCALLFFPPDLFATQDDLVRRALGEGHSIGILVPGASMEEATAAIEEGNRLLTHVARTRTRMILVDGANTVVTQDLNQQGWLCWQTAIDGTQGSRTGSTSAYIMGQAGRKQTLARVIMDDSAVSVAALPAVLRTLRQEKYIYRLVVETGF